VISLRSFAKPVTGLANKMSQWLGENPAVVILIAILIAVAWGGYRSAVWFAYDIMPAHDARILDGMKSIQQHSIDAHERMRDDNASDMRYVVDVFAKERERDRERDKEREAMMREIKEWLRGAKADATLKRTQPTAALPAG
jgi:hypothetical protein